MEVWPRVIEVCPFPNITAVGGPGLDGKSCASTVDLRRRIASAPESKRAELATFAAHDSGPASASQAEWSRPSLGTPRRASSSATLAANARAFLLPPLPLLLGVALLRSILELLLGALPPAAALPLL